MRQPLRLPAILVAALIVAGCTAQASPSSSASSSPPISRPSATPSTPSGDSAAPSGTAPSGEPTASEDLGAFTCDLPIVEDATVALANITDVRVGTHEGYDRVVFEFAQGLPEISLDRASPPFTQDASGLPIDVDGSSFLQLTMRGGSKQTDEGTSSYEGPVEFAPEFETLVHLIEGGDFERQSTWYFGLDAEACVRVDSLEGEGGSTLLVIDLEH
jgi:hypothetical protein